MNKSLIGPFSLTSYVLLVLLTFFLSEDIFQLNVLSMDPSLRLAISLLLAFVPFLILDAIMYAFHNHNGFISEHDGLPVGIDITYKHAFQSPKITTLRNGNINVDFGNGHATFNSMSSKIQSIKYHGSLAICIRNKDGNSLTYIGNWDKN